ncbi:hypothetical protein L7F22_067113 [Adiantum nelumboides]|nr:hypothetical protein [Adiantum nelumboides]
MVEGSRSLVLTRKGSYFFMVVMACSSSDNSPTSSSTSDETSEDNVEDSFWGVLARKAKIVLEDSSSEFQRKNPKMVQRVPVSDGLILQKNGSRQLMENKWKRQESIVLNKGLEAIASSWSLLSDLGNALEEGINLVETKATNFMYTDPRSRPLKKSLDSTVSEKCITSVPNHHGNLEGKLSRSQVKSEEKITRSQAKSNEKVLKSQIKAEEKQGVTKDTQLKASRDVAMAMATKAKLLLRELKGVKTDLAFTKARCTQLEEENKRLRENVDKGEKHEEDDLVWLQLEALLAEKARLVQENAAYARENQFLHEVVQYHQLRLRSIGFPGESLMMDDEGALNASAVDMDFLPLYPEEKDIIALEESVKIATQHVA